MTDINPDQLVPKRIAKNYTAEFSDMDLHRRIKARTFPAPAETIDGVRYWRLGDLIAWRNGKRSGWPAESGQVVEQRRQAVLKRTRGRAPWAGDAA